MNQRHADVRRTTVYHGRGEALAQSVEVPDTPEPHPPYRRTIASLVQLNQIMTTELVCARADLGLGAVVSLMVRHRVGCLPIVDHRRHPVGIITKLDLVEQLEGALHLIGEGKPLPPDLHARTADEVMMPLALTLPEDATVAQAAAMMQSEDTHHVMVVSAAGTLVGVVSSRDIVGWLVDNDTMVMPDAAGAGAKSWVPADED